MTAAAPAPTAIPWHRRLEARVLIAVTLIAGISLAAVLLAADRVVAKYSFARSEEELVAARAAFDRLVESRARFASAQTRLIAELPVFRATLDPASNIGGDAETISAMADDYAASSLPNSASSPTPAASGSALPDGRPGQTGEWRRRADRVRTYRTRLTRNRVDGQWPVPRRLRTGALCRRGPGTITAAYKLDDTVAAELALETHCEVNLVCASNRLCGSSLPAPQRSTLTALSRIAAACSATRITS